jgi:hypothetical protein
LIELFIWHGFCNEAIVTGPLRSRRSIHFKPSRSPAMFKSLTSRALLATALITAVCVLPATAMAREGGPRSVGKGIKCYTTAVKQADGTIAYEQICYKGV